MITRHFAFFRQGSGAWVREWKGPVPEPPQWVVRLRWAFLLNYWATVVSGAQRGEIGLDVTHIQWPVGDFCYCRFDEVDRRLDWGPPRHYIEVNIETMEVVANTESHRPVRDAVPGQHVIDITGTRLESHFGHIFGRFTQLIDGGWMLMPNQALPEAQRRALASAAVVLELYPEPARVAV